KTGAAQEGKPEAYILQAGSFKNFAEADRLKASLNLIGIEAGIQTVTVNNKDTWHRVQIGPYRDVAELNAVRARLKQNNIDAVLLKLKG
ncbi:MAG: SPOR domain-containing protein, partial [Gammaproteobacteria bacterium]